MVFFFAGIFGVLGATATSEILTVNCDNIELIADSAWVICQHDKKGFTWEDVEKCEVNSKYVCKEQTLNHFWLILLQS